MPNDLLLRELLKSAAVAANALVEANAGDLQQHYIDVRKRIEDALFLLRNPIRSPEEVEEAGC